VSINVSCPKCKRKITAPDQLWGKWATCRKCGARLRLKGPPTCPRCGSNATVKRFGRAATGFFAICMAPLLWVFLARPFKCRDCGYCFGRRGGAPLILADSNR